MPSHPLAMITYSPRRQTYVNSNGRVTTEPEVRLWLRDQVAEERGRLKLIMRQQIQGRLPLVQWQSQTLEELRRAHTAIAAVAAGGVDRLTPAHYEIINQVMLQEEAFLIGFAGDIRSGRMQDTLVFTSMGRISRVQLYASALKLTFYAAELATKQAEGGWLGWRRRDPATRSCKECTRHDTKGWVPVDRITPIGWRCTCRNNCQCRIRFLRSR